MKLIRLLPLALVFILLAGPFIGIVTAEDGDDDSIDDTIEDLQERELEIENSTNEARVKSTFQNASIENEISIKIITDNGIKLKLEYGTEINGTEQEVELSISFRDLIEYYDTNENGIFDNGEEIQSIDLRSLAYSAPNVTAISSADGELGYQLESHLINESYSFQIIGEMFLTYAMVENLTIAPTDMKVTIVIDDFPFLQTNTSLALVIKAETELETSTETDDDSVSVETDSAMGFFSWANETLVDDVLVHTNSTTSDLSDDSSEIVISYVQGTTIIHDPTLGLQISSTSNTGTPGNGLLGGGLLLDLAVVGGVFVVIIVAIILVRRR